MYIGWTRLIIKEPPAQSSSFIPAHPWTKARKNGFQVETRNSLHSLLTPSPSIPGALNSICRFSLARKAGPCANKALKIKN